MHVALCYCGNRNAQRRTHNCILALPALQNMHEHGLPLRAVLVLLQQAGCVTLLICLNGWGGIAAALSL
jgi:hypothetical protein